MRSFGAAFLFGAMKPVPTVISQSFCMNTFLMMSRSPSL